MFVGANIVRLQSSPCMLLPGKAAASSGWQGARNAYLRPTEYFGMPSYDMWYRPVCAVRTVKASMAALHACRVVGDRTVEPINQRSSPLQTILRINFHGTPLDINAVSCCRPFRPVKVALLLLCHLLEQPRAGSVKFRPCCVQKIQQLHQNFIHARQTDNI